MSNRDVTDDLQVKDVYDFAFDIAQEFENTLTNVEESYSLINKVIKVLELLESSVKKIERLEIENCDLNYKYEQLLKEKVAIDEEKFDLKLSFEELEESWFQESKDLKALVSKLKKDNELLKTNLDEKNTIPLEIGDSYKTVIDEQENIISNLKLSLKRRDDQLEKDRTVIEVLNSKIEHLLKLNKSLHLRHQEVKCLLSASSLEKTHFELKLASHEQKIHLLENCLENLKKVVAEKKELGLNDDLQSVDEMQCLGKENVNFWLHEQHELKEQISKLQAELAAARNQTDLSEQSFRQDAEPQKSSFPGDGSIQQIFRLFLGFNNINSQLCWFRGI